MIINIGINKEIEMGIYGELETGFQNVEASVLNEVKPVEAEVVVIAEAVKKTIAERLEAIEADFVNIKSDAEAFTSKVEAFMSKIANELKLIL